MKFIGNLIWSLTLGIPLFISYMVMGIILHITIIGIPLGKQCFKMGVLSLAPFGKDAILEPKGHAFGNFIWCILFGLWTGIYCYFLGAILHITIIGIPFGKQFFKLGKLSFKPFGAEVVA